MAAAEGADSGEPEEHALLLGKMVTLLLIERAERELREAGVPPFVDGEPEWINTAPFDWLDDATAAMAGA